MHKMNIYRLAIVTMALVLTAYLGTLGVLATPQHSVTGKNSVPRKNIVQTAAQMNSLKIFTAAVKQADLVSMLEGKGPYTVFAPSDAAFAKLPKGVLSKLMANKKSMRTLLLYHVVPKKLMSCDIQYGSAATASKEYVMLNVNKACQVAQVDGALVKNPDIQCSNGVLHIIDEVLTPRSGLEDLAQAPANERQSTAN